MADILELMGGRQDWISERYELVRERMEELAKEEIKELFWKEPLSELALFLVDCMRVYDLGEAQILESLPEEKRQAVMNQLAVREKKVREQLMGESTEQPWQNGSAEESRQEIWPLLFQVLAQLCVPCAAYCIRREQLLLTIHAELFVQIHQIFQLWSAGEETEEQSLAEVKEAIYYHLRDYCDLMLAYNRQDLQAAEIAGKDAVVIAVDGQEPSALSASQRLERQEKKLCCVTIRDNVWNRLLTGYGGPAVPLFFDRAFRERLLSEEKKMLEQKRDMPAGLEIILVPGFPEFGSMELSNKNRFLYEEYLSEVHELRQRAASSIDGKICVEIR